MMDFLKYFNFLFLNYNHLNSFKLLYYVGLPMGGSYASGCVQSY